MSLEIGRHIKDITSELVAESGSDFSSSTIVIEIAAPNVPDLTVVDLPGIIRTTIDGQDQKVVREVNDLIEAYIKQERTIILVVIPGPADISTVEGLERAKRVDPLGIRTIGVVTKPDLVNPGAEKEVPDVVQNQK